MTSQSIALESRQSVWQTARDERARSQLGSAPVEPGEPTGQGIAGPNTVGSHSQMPIDDASPPAWRRLARWLSKIFLMAGSGPPPA